MKVGRIAIAFLALGPALAGCAERVDNLAIVNGESLASQAEASRRLSESAERAAVAQEELARIQAARTRPVPAPVDENLSGVPEDLRRPVTLEWSGPAEEAARRVTAVVGWEFRVVGNAPSAPTMIDVSLRARPAVKALEDVGLQAQPFGQVVVLPGARRVEYRYVHSVRGATAARASMTK